jgi:hypothetical protein
MSLANAPIATKLSFSLNKVFNDNYDKTNELDTKIQTNEDLIHTYIDSYNEQYLKNLSLFDKSKFFLSFFIAENQLLRFYF